MSGLLEGKQIKSKTISKDKIDKDQNADPAFYVLTLDMDFLNNPGEEGIVLTGKDN